MAGSQRKTGGSPQQPRCSARILTTRLDPLTCSVVEAGWRGLLTLRWWYNRSSTSLIGRSRTDVALALNADFVLVLKLLHWTGDNVELTRRPFMESGLYRLEKTERKTGETTYLDMTINNAIRKRRNPLQKR